MHLLVFEPRLTGHHLVYVKHLLAGALALVDRITLLLPAGAESTLEFGSHIHPITSAIDVRTILDNRFSRSSLAWGRRLLAELHKATNSLCPDHIWLPSGDTLAVAGGFARMAGRWRTPVGVEAECGLIHAAFHLPASSLVRRARRAVQLQLVARSPWRRLLTNDFLLRDTVRARGGAWCDRLELVPDPIEPFDPLSRAEARAKLGLPTDGRIVGTAGSFSSNPRKGVRELLRAFAQMQRQPDDRLLLAGQLGPDLRAQIEGEFAELLRLEKILFIDRYLSDQDLYASLAAMDVVCLPYQGHTSTSAVALRAAQASRPLLASNAGWLGKIVPLLGLGRTIPSFEPTLFAHEIAAALDAAQGYQVSVGCERLVRYCHPENYSCRWRARLLERLGKAPDRQTLTWEWVLAGACE